MAGMNVTLGTTAGHEAPGGQRGGAEHPTAVSKAILMPRAPRQIRLTQLGRTPTGTGCGQSVWDSGRFLPGVCGSSDGGLGPLYGGPAGP
jgi:hypothetical protein